MSEPIAVLEYRITRDKVCINPLGVKVIWNYVGQKLEVITAKPSQPFKIQLTSGWILIFDVMGQPLFKFPTPNEVTSGFDEYRFWVNENGEYVKYTFEIRADCFYQSENQATDYKKNVNVEKIYRITYGDNYIRLVMDKDFEKTRKRIQNVFGVGSIKNIEVLYVRVD